MNPYTGQLSPKMSTQSAFTPLLSPAQAGWWVELHEGAERWAGGWLAGKPAASRFPCPGCTGCEGGTPATSSCLSHVGIQTALVPEIKLQHPWWVQLFRLLSAPCPHGSGH